MLSFWFLPYSFARVVHRRSANRCYIGTSSESENVVIQLNYQVSCLEVCCLYFYSIQNLISHSVLSLVQFNHKLVSSGMGKRGNYFSYKVFLWNSCITLPHWLPNFVFYTCWTLPFMMFLERGMCENSEKIETCTYDGPCNYFLKWTMIMQKPMFRDIRSWSQRGWV
jgi:hypothetical protein